jgi:hypothetical protein
VIGDFLELGRDRRLVGVDAGLPFIKPIGEREMHAQLAAIGDAAGFEIESGNILGTDVTVGIDPHRGNAGGAEIMSRKLVSLFAAAPG